MEKAESENRNYAHLPDELLGKILENVPETVQKMNSMFDFQEEPIKQGIEELRGKGMLKTISSKDYSTSLIAVDGGMILERMTGTDLMLAVAVGVEGLTEGTQDWGEGHRKGDGPARRRDKGSRK